MKSFFEKEGIDAYALCSFEGVKLRLERKLEPLRKEWGRDPQWVLVFLVPYYVGEEEGNLSLYARSRDYHRYFEGLYARLREYLWQKGDASRFAGFCDNSPAFEVDLAAGCGLGVKGDHGLLIHPRYGSYVFIGEIFWERKPDLPVTPLGEFRECSHCGACRDACPVQGKMSLCLSGISQKKSLCPEEEALLRQHRVVWGCDRCQLACPQNQGCAQTSVEFFREDRIPYLSRELLMDLQQRGLLDERAFAWRGLQVPLRNLSLTL